MITWWVPKRRTELALMGFPLNSAIRYKIIARCDNRTPINIVNFNKDVFLTFIYFDKLP